MRHIPIILTIALGVSGPSLAQDDEEEIFDQSIRNFGFEAGAAWQCSAEDARGAAESDALTAYNGLVRLFGTDRAFGFAAAFGAGTTATVPKEECDSHIAAFEDGMAASRNISGGTGQ
jgi:hypothetical protein